jgi:hypothetical protein
VRERAQARPALEARQRPGQLGERVLQRIVEVGSRPEQAEQQPAHRRQLLGQHRGDGVRIGGAQRCQPWIGRGRRSGPARRQLHSVVSPRKLANTAG